jgi:hypothetical protein
VSVLKLNGEGQSRVDRRSVRKKASSDLGKDSGGKATGRYIRSNRHMAAQPAVQSGHCVVNKVLVDILVRHGKVGVTMPSRPSRDVSEPMSETVNVTTLSMDW